MAQHAALNRGLPCKPLLAATPPSVHLYLNHTSAGNSLGNLSSTPSAPPLLDQAGLSSSSMAAPSSSSMAGPSSANGSSTNDLCVVCLDNPRQTVLVSALGLQSVLPQAVCCDVVRSLTLLFALVCVAVLPHTAALPLFGPP